MSAEPLLHEGVLLTLPPQVAALRVRFAGGGGRGRIDVELCNGRARRILVDESLDQPRLEEAVQRLLDALRPSWASGQAGSGSLLIDLGSGEARLDLDAVG
jgi:hypothetical protein